MQRYVDEGDDWGALQIMKRHEDTHYAIPETFRYTPHLAKKRRAMTAWMIQLVEHCQLSPDVLAMAINTLDRFIYKTRQQDPCSFQLVALTCLYTCVKMHARVIFNLETMVKFSNDIFTKEQIQQMELHILTTLEWKMNPPSVLWWSTQIRRRRHLIHKHGQKRHFTSLMVCQLEYILQEEAFVGISPFDLAWTMTKNALPFVSGQRHHSSTISTIPPALEEELLDHLMDHHSNAMLYHRCEPPLPVMDQLSPRAVTTKMFR